MKMTDTAEKAGEKIVEALKNPDSLPAPMAKILILRNNNLPCSKWSWRNRFLAVAAGHTDARGFRQWEQAGRKVKSGEKAFYILSPLAMTRRNEEGEERRILYGWKATPVGGRSQTEGKEIPDIADGTKWLNHLLLIEVAKSWGIKVDAIPAGSTGAWGAYVWGDNTNAIILSCKNINVFLHELIHAADLRNGSKLQQDWKCETVADLGSAILISMMGLKQEQDLGGCFKYVQHYAEKSGRTVLEACGIVLDRICEAVKLILDEAEHIEKGQAA